MKNAKTFGFIVGFIIIISIILIASSVKGTELSLNTNQTDFYFKTGQNAIVPISVDNPYNTSLNGMISYTIKQTMQGNNQASQQMRSQSYTLQKEQDVLNMELGSMNQPGTLELSISFSYTANQTKYKTNLDSIKVHFVENQSQNNSQQQSKQSTKQQSSQQKSQTTKQQNPQQQTTKQQSNPNDMQNRLQNNQASQDAKNLKKQLQKEQQAQKQMEQKLEENIQKSEEFQDMKKQLEKEGYKLDNKNLQPETNNSGDFQYNYKKGNDTASIKGKMNDGEMSELKKTESKSKEDMLKKLEQNKKYQNLTKQLKEQGFNNTKTTSDNHGEETKLKQEFKNKLNQTKEIVATFRNNTIQDIKLKEDTDYWPYLLFLLIPLIALLFFRKKPKKQPENATKPFDYKTHVKELIEQARKLFDNQEIKEAYAKAAQSIRTYYIYNLNLNREITNSDLIKVLEEKHLASKDIKDCLQNCDMVEFAKGKGTRKEFDKLLGLIKKLVD